MPSEGVEPFTDGLTGFVDAVPKVELHVHLEGSIALPTLLELTRTQPDSMLPRSEEGLLALYRFRDFAHFLEVYLLICRHLRSAEDFALITRELGASLAAQNVRYAEVTATPMGHVLRGVAPEALFEGIEQGRAEAKAEHGVRLRWCTDIDGRGGPELALQTVELVLRHRPGWSAWASAARRCRAPSSGELRDRPGRGPAQCAARRAEGSGPQRRPRRLPATGRGAGARRRDRQRVAPAARSSKRAPGVGVIATQHRAARRRQQMVSAGLTVRRPPTAATAQPAEPVRYASTSVIACAVLWKNTARIPSRLAATTLTSRSSRKTTSLGRTSSRSQVIS